MLPTQHCPVMVTQHKSRCNMDMPIPSVIGDYRAHFHQSHDNPFVESPCCFTSHIETTDYVEQIIGEKSHFQTGFVRREPVTACIFPAQRVFAFLIQFSTLPRPLYTLTTENAGSLEISAHALKYSCIKVKSCHAQAYQLVSFIFRSTEKYIMLTAVLAHYKFGFGED